MADMIEIPAIALHKAIEKTMNIANNLQWACEAKH